MGCRIFYVGFDDNAGWCDCYTNILIWLRDGSIDKRGPRSLVQQYGSESLLTIKGNDAFTLHSIGNFSVLLDQHT